jgi:virginiamycin B lyase
MEALLANFLESTIMSRAKTTAVAFSALSWAGVAFGASPPPGTISEFAVPTAGSQPTAIATGPDGALWFTEEAGNKIGRITTDGVVTEFALPTVASNPVGIVAGPDGALWFTEFAGNKIGRITTDGVVTEYPLGTPGSQPNLLTVGQDGALWFTEYGNVNIGRITTSGVITEFAIPTPHSGPLQVVPGADGNLWFVESGANKIGRITPAGVITEFTNPEISAAVGTTHAITPGPDGQLYYTDAHNLKIGAITTAGVFKGETPIPTFEGGAEYIALGPDGAVWFVENLANKIVRAGIAADGSFSFTEYDVPTAASSVATLVAGPDGNLWFTEHNTNKIGRLTPNTSPSPILAAVLPSSRSVMAGTNATAFATMINTGATPLTNCGIVPLSNTPANFSFQTTNSSNNAPTGVANSKVSVAAGAAQSFIFGFAVNAPFIPENVSLAFDCDGTDPAQPIVGLNTFLLSGSATPVPDIVALGATATNDGILSIKGTNGSGAFAVATVNVGAAAASITATATIGTVTLPIALTICRSNPSTAACLQPAAPTAVTAINANETPTFSIFATASGAIANSPAVNRIFVRFTDAQGVVRGSTSVAVRTQ